jgi:hypothetical protein
MMDVIFFIKMVGIYSNIDPDLNGAEKGKDKGFVFQNGDMI